MKTPIFFILDDLNTADLACHLTKPNWLKRHWNSLLYFPFLVHGMHMQGNDGLSGSAEDETLPMTFIFNDQSYPDLICHLTNPNRLKRHWNSRLYFLFFTFLAHGTHMQGNEWSKWICRRWKPPLISLLWSRRRHPSIFAIVAQHRSERECRL